MPRWGATTAGKTVRYRGGSDGARWPGVLGAASPILSMARGRPRHHHLLLPSGKHAEQTLASDALPRSPTRGRRAMSLDVLYERCSGLDLHKRSVTACRIVPGA